MKFKRNIKLENEIGLKINKFVNNKVNNSKFYSWCSGKIEEINELNSKKEQNVLLEDVALMFEDMHDFEVQNNYLENGKLTEIKNVLLGKKEKSYKFKLENQIEIKITYLKYQ